VFHNGAVTLLAFQRNPPIFTDAATAATAARDPDAPLVLDLPGPLHAYDVLGAKELGHADRLKLTLDGSLPTILAVSAQPLPEMTLAAPAALRLGETGRIEVAWAGPSPAALHVVHLELFDPAGRLVRHYSANLFARGTAAAHRLPLALNDAVGAWRVRATDVLGGRSVEAAIEVVAGPD
jgi:hypothetical protein